MQKKSLPLGHADFKELINQDLYYVDKTGLIKEIIDTQSKIMLFTRPRRFGKTLNQSMLKYFFEKTEEDNSTLFNGLEISGYDGKYMKIQGQYPVIYVTFKDMKFSTYDKSFKQFKEIISNEFKRHSYVLNSPEILPDDKTIFKRIMSKDADEVEFANGMAHLTGCLNKFYHEQVIILIDEYDVPLENAHFCGFYSDMVDLIRLCFSSALKDNTKVKYGILTGCLRVSKESIFTGFNNLKVYSIKNENFSTYFGFTKAEVDKMLEYYEISDSIDEVREWYDGYIFGNTEIYNPFSLVNYVLSRMENDNEYADTYWSNTSSNSIITDLITKCNDETREKLEKLMRGESLTKKIYDNLTYGDIESGDSSDQIWSYLLFTGYLKQRYIPERREYELTIPNHEVMTIYTDLVQKVFRSRLDSSSRDDFFRAVLSGDTAKIEQTFKEWIYKSISYHDNKEDFYHGVMLGLLSGFDGYKVKSNRESGDGRFDIIVYDAMTQSVGVVFEFKFADNVRQMSDICDKALAQIRDKHYEEELYDVGITNIIRYGVAFYKKICMVKCEEK